MTLNDVVKYHYLDASALVKLVTDDADGEPGRRGASAVFLWALALPCYVLLRG